MRIIGYAEIDKHILEGGAITAIFFNGIIQYRIAVREKPGFCYFVIEFKQKVKTVTGFLYL